MSAKEKLAKISGYILLAGFFIAMLTIGIIFIKGILWFSETIYPYLLIVGSALFWFGIIVLLPLAFFKKTRLVAATGFLISAYFYGILLWLTALITVHALWGLVGVVIGFVVAVVGMIPEAFIASLFTRSWDDLWNLFLWLLITLVHAGLGFWLILRHQKDVSLTIDLD